MKRTSVNLGKEDDDTLLAHVPSGSAPIQSYTIIKDASVTHDKLTLKVRGERLSGLTVEGLNSGSGRFRVGAVGCGDSGRCGMEVSFD